MPENRQCGDSARWERDLPDQRRHRGGYPKALEACGLPAVAVQSIDNPDRALVAEMLRMDKYIDMLIPRGGAGLHKLCREQSTIPVITGGIGVCHIYVDDTAEIAPALKIIVNAKTQRPSTCNTVETLLVHQDIAERFLPALSQRWRIAVLRCTVMKS